MMSFQEREELEAEYNARHDYLQEAFGAEARMLADQAQDDMEFEAREATEAAAKAAGLSVEEYNEIFATLELYRRLDELAKARLAEETDNVPF